MNPEDLTPALMSEVLGKLDVLPPGLPIFGIAAHPGDICRLRYHQPPLGCWLMPFERALPGDIPFISDIRRPFGKIEVFYDFELWVARCEEQRYFDARPLPQP